MVTGVWRSGRMEKSAVDFPLRELQIRHTHVTSRVSKPALHQLNSCLTIASHPFMVSNIPPSLSSIHPSNTSTLFITYIVHFSLPTSFLSSRNPRTLNFQSPSRKIIKSLQSMQCAKKRKIRYEKRQPPPYDTCNAGVFNKQDACIYPSCKRKMKSRGERHGEKGRK